MSNWTRLKGSLYKSNSLREVTKEVLLFWERLPCQVVKGLGAESATELCSIIGEEARRQILVKENVLPDALVACIGGGSNALGMFYPFMDDDVKLIGVEAAGYGVDSGKTAAWHQRWCRQAVC